MREQTAVPSAASALVDAHCDHRIRELPILVLFPHNRCNCRCMMCDIWKIRQVREITAEDLKPHIASLRALKVRWIVFSGGEPLMHSHFSSLARMCRAEGVRLTLLTAGLLLEKYAERVAECVDDLIVSLDGPPEIHDQIRAVPGAYARLAHGIRALRKLRPQVPIHGRCTVQKSNFQHIRATVQTAHELNLNSLSFLAADVSSEAFNRPHGWSQERQANIALECSEVEELDSEIKSLIRDYREEIDSGFISDSPDRLHRIALHFRAHLGHALPVAPRCNAPWVSAVVEADGTLRPCFFHRPLGNIHEGPLTDILNSREALEFRQQLDIANNPVCRNCVCSLYLKQEPG